MNQKQVESSNEKGSQRQQGPKWMFKVLNPMMKLILKSPLHGGLSKRVMIISFTGQKSGKKYSTPVAYVQQADRVIVVTYSHWRNNFKKPAPVQMRIQGKNINGIAVLVSEPEKTREILITLENTNGKEVMKRMGFWIEGLDSLSPEAIQQATQGVYFIEVVTK